VTRCIHKPLRSYSKTHVFIAAVGLTSSELVAVIGYTNESMPTPDSVVPRPGDRVVEHDERSPLLGANSNLPTDRTNGHRHGDHQDDSPYLIPVSKRHFWLIFGPILLQFFVAMFDSYFMSTSHPVITSYFHASNSASWLSTAFMLTSTAFQPVFGRLSDTIGRRPVYLASLTWFIAATTWCGLAQSIGSFIAARAVCGIAAGGMMAMVSTTLAGRVMIY
jgi:hypothetical protein